MLRLATVAFMILSSYERRDSPFVWVQYADACGIKRYIKTRIRKDDLNKLVKVAKELNRVEAGLLNAKPFSRGSWNWVPAYLRQRYAARSSTRRAYLIQWNWLSAYLQEREVAGPEALNRDIVFGYLDWRRGQTKQKSRRHPGLNTALGELKLLGLVMDEAIRRGQGNENPVRKLSVEREEAPLKPEMTDIEIATIYASPKPDWMHKSFHIALHTALRFGDTAIERSRVNWATKEIVIEEPKGGRRRAFAIQIYPSIRAMIEEFMDSGQAVLWSLPLKERVLTGLYWTRFFRKIGLSHLCFHCTRVSFITRGARGGVPESAMMKMANHASKEIHRIYQRLATADALRYRSQIAIPTYVDATEGSQPETPSG